MCSAHKLQCNAAPNACALCVCISCNGREQHPLPRYQACALYIHTSCNIFGKSNLRDCSCALCVCISCNYIVTSNLSLCSIHTHKLQLYITQVCRASARILCAEFQLTFVRLPYRVYLQPNTFGLTHTFSISGHQAALDKINQIFFVSSLMILSISFIAIF